MLTPNFLDQIPDRVVQLYSDVELKIISDIARRINKEGYLTQSGLWQMQAIQRDFIEQTELRRDYFRERAGKQNT